MSALDDAPLVQPEDRAGWRAWLEANHATSLGAWLVMWRPSSGRLAVDYEAAVEEALCFGWIDSVTGRVDEERSKQYFAPRKPRGTWSASNKARVERLMAAGRMAPAGLAAIERAKANGAWVLLDGVERMEVPDDLTAALVARPPAAERFAAWAPSMRKALLGWLVLAMRPETRAARIAAIVTAAERNELPGPFQRRD
jgi:uncharacterized protein YdeI (YjbR/CyaY-like superfamily)